MDPPSSRPGRPKARQSLAHVNSAKELDYDKENATADLGSMRQRKSAASEFEKKKSRSKSLGPGGLEALRESAGNATKVMTTIIDYVPYD
jgi:kinetochore protein Spc7/SPC105